MFLSQFQRDKRVLVVWSDNLDGIIPICRDFEDNLIKLVWSQRHSLTSITPGPSIAGASTPPTGGGGGNSHDTSATNSASSDMDINEKPREAESTTPEPESSASASKPISGGSSPNRTVRTFSLWCRHELMSGHWPFLLVSEHADVSIQPRHSCPGHRRF